jgi:flagellar hook-associated protein 3 FlgL
MGMRVTNTMLVRNMTGYISSNLSRMQKFQYMIANGKKIELPSDDPVVASRALKLRTDLAEVEQYKRNVDDATSWLDTTEVALGNIGDVMQRVRELSVQGASGHRTDDDLKKVNDEVKQLKKQLVNLGNSTYAGRYVFSGFGTNQPLLDEEGLFLNDVKSTENIKYEIGIGDSIEINVLGGDLFNAGGEAVGAVKSSSIGTNDITFPLDIVDGVNDELTITVDEDSSATIDITEGTYNNMDDFIIALQGNIDNQIGAGKVNVSNEDDELKLTSETYGENSLLEIDIASTAATSLGMDTVDFTEGADGEKGSLISTMDEIIEAMDTGDSEKISELLDSIDDELNTILRVRADVGARQNRLELTNNRLESDTVNFTRLMSLNEDVDMAEAIMQLQNEENLYNASLSGGAKIIMPSLVDFLS